MNSSRSVAAVALAVLATEALLVTLPKQAAAAAGAIVAGAQRVGAAGTVGQGFAGGNGNPVVAFPFQAGGGGGAGEAGNTDGLGFGGDGDSSTITGTLTVLRRRRRRWSGSGRVTGR